MLYSSDFEAIISKYNKWSNSYQGPKDIQIMYEEKLKLD